MAHAVGIADVAREDIEPTPNIRRAAVEPTLGIERIVKHKRLHGLTVTNKRVDEVGSDEAVRARGEDCRVN